jgi:ATP-binding cassette, subfamily C, bacterial
VATAPRAYRALRQLVAAILTFAPQPAFWSVVVTTAVGFTEGIGLLLLVPLLQLVGLETGQAALGGIVRAFFALFAAVGVPPTLPSVLVFYVAVVAAQAALRRRQNVLKTDTHQRVNEGLRRRVYRALAGAEWTFLARHRSSDALHVLTAEIQRVGTAVYYLVDLFAASLTTIVYVGLAFAVSPAMTAMLLLLGAVLSLVMRGPMSNAHQSGERLSTSTSRFYAAIAEHLSGMKLAKGYGAVSRHAEAFDALTREVGAVNVEATRQYARLQEQFAIGSAIVLAAIVYLSYEWLRVSTVQLLFLLFLFARLVPRFTGIYERLQELAAALPAFSAVLDLEARCRAAAEQTTPHTIGVALRHRLRLEHVTFAYRSDDVAALQDVSIDIAAGTTVAIVGVSGSGKSTLADVVMGLLTPGAGRVTIDSVPLDAASRDAWRARIGIVPQDTFLFHDTVRANLLWAHAEASEDDLRRALRLASAEDFVMALPQALETVVGDRGVLLSGGERQRLSLARALLRNPDLLILDEATSSLDSENEGRIRDAIENLHREVTIVVITHRLSMVRGADAIHVLERGRVVESGSWAELWARSHGRFRELCLAQGLTDDVPV